MSTYYKFTVKRNFDNKVVGMFYFNAIKALNEVYVQNSKLKIDLDEIRSDGFTFTDEDVKNDINALRQELSLIHSKIFEKKLLMPMSANVDVKFEIESDIKDLEENANFILNGIEALAGLHYAITIVVEDMVISKLSNENDDEEVDSAYVYNAEGLPKDENGHVQHLWVDGVHVEAQIC